MSELHFVVPYVITVNTVLDVAKKVGMAHNSGAGGEFLLVGTEAQVIAFGRTLRNEPVRIDYGVIDAYCRENEMDYNRACAMVHRAVNARPETEGEYAARKARENDARAAELQRNGHA